MHPGCSFTQLARQQSYILSQRRAHGRHRCAWSVAYQSGGGLRQHLCRTFQSVQAAAVEPLSSSLNEQVMANDTIGSACSPLETLIHIHGARLTTAAQMAWAQVIHLGDTVVDATCGNGLDTLFLAQAVGPSGTVYAIDIQDEAIASTKQQLSYHIPAAAMPHLHMIRDCHSGMQAVVGSNQAKVICFNLGYLPRGDKSVITTSSSTLAAVQAALEVVCPGGLITILAYIGHPGGFQEYEAVKQLVCRLSPAQWLSSEVRLLNRPKAPILLSVWRHLDNDVLHAATFQTGTIAV
eukprot:jgi/Chrzof1/7679/Cz02g32200.t1